MEIRLDRRIKIEQKAVSQDANYGNEVVAWLPLATVWAEVRDVLPSRAEGYGRNLALARNQTRIRFRYRSDVNSSNRITLLGTEQKVMQIISGPAEIGRKEYQEVMCETYSS